MGKSKRSFREHNGEQELLNENKILKREIERLKKLLSRTDIEKDSQLDEIIDKKFNSKDKLKEEWRCNGTPGCEGYLEIIRFNKIDQEHYFRQCNSCFHRTRSQKWTDSVKGIIKKS